jgi:hypothetical protein
MRVRQRGGKDARSYKTCEMSHVHHKQRVDLIRD